MPELPDVEVYVFKIKELFLGQKLLDLKLYNPFFLRTTVPQPFEFVDHKLTDVIRLGKRIAIGFEGDIWAVIHPMISGRFLSLPETSNPPKKITHVSFQFVRGALILTEASSHKRASLHLVSGKSALDAHRPAGIEPLLCTYSEFKTAITMQNRTIKRALTDPATMSGIGNAYSDEILWRAQLSPVKLTRSLSEKETAILFASMQETLSDWTNRLLVQFANKFPGKGDITAFRPDFAVHGKFECPCPACGLPVQRIVYASNETNYCAVCQNEGRRLADRALSRLLKSDWHRSMAELGE